MPHALYHFLSDADIRVRDGQYASAQQNAMLAVADHLDGGGWPAAPRPSDPGHLTAIVAVWALVTVLAAWQYVSSRLRLPGLEGYEADWHWQLWFFTLSRLPLYLLGLGVALVLWKYVSPRG